MWPLIRLRRTSPAAPWWGSRPSPADADGSDTVTYSLSSNPGGLFQIDPATGVVTVAPGAAIDFETATSHTIEVTATSSDSSTSAQSFTIGVTDDTSEFTVTAITDTDVAADQVAENATGGTVVGITAFASDADGSDTVTYSPEQRTPAACSRSTPSPAWSP